MTALHGTQDQDLTPQPPVTTTASMTPISTQHMILKEMAQLNQALHGNPSNMATMTIILMLAMESMGNMESIMTKKPMSLSLEMTGTSSALLQNPSLRGRLNQTQIDLKWLAESLQTSSCAASSRCQGIVLEAQIATWRMGTFVRCTTLMHSLHTWQSTAIVLRSTRMFNALTLHASSVNMLRVRTVTAAACVIWHECWSFGAR